MVRKRSIEYNLILIMMNPFKFPNFLAVFVLFTSLSAVRAEIPSLEDLPKVVAYFDKHGAEATAKKFPTLSSGNPSLGNYSVKESGNNKGDFKSFVEWRLNKNLDSESDARDAESCERSALFALFIDYRDYYAPIPFFKGLGRSKEVKLVASQPGQILIYTSNDQ